MVDAPAPTPALRLEPTLETDEAAIQWLGAAIDAFNERAMGVGQDRRISVWLRDGDGTVKGGCTGYIVGGDECYVTLLYVDESLRGQGHGEKLLTALEELAAREKCRFVALDTFDFQAPGFYRRLGYVSFGRIDDFFRGHGRTWFKKMLGAPA